MRCFSFGVHRVLGAVWLYLGMPAPTHRRPELDPCRVLWVLWICGVALGSLTRAALLSGVDPQLDLTGSEILRALWVGCRLDASISAYMAAPLLLLIPFSRSSSQRPRRIATRLTATWALLAWTILVLSSGADWAFLRFFGYRMNYLVLDHAGDREVLLSLVEMPYVWQSVSLAAFALLVSLAAICWRRQSLLRLRERSVGWGRGTALATLVLMVAFARGTLDHRPINPAAASIGPHRALNEIASSGLFAVAYEGFRRTRGEQIRVEEVAGKLPPEEARARAAQLTSHRKRDGPERRPRNVVVVVMESFTGRLVGAMGGEPALSPEFDRLADEGLLLTHCYATGERTVQGLEAVVASFPPLPGVSIVRRPEAQRGVATLASAAQRHGYDTLFLYGGQGIFDHMRSFFVGNGFERFIEERDFEDPVFRGSWGVSDEDLFARANREFEARAAQGQPFLAVLLTVSLHAPWEFPPGRVQSLPEDMNVPEGFERRELENFLYADFAVGKFIRQARSYAYFDDTLFVFVGDHGVHLRSRALVPAEEYRVPALLLAPGTVPPGRIDAVTSQVDLAPTILSLVGWDPEPDFFGRDVLAASERDPMAVLLYRKERYAVRRANRLTVLAKEGGVGSAYRLTPAGFPLHDQIRYAYQEDAKDGLAVLQQAEQRLQDRLTDLAIASRPASPLESERALRP